jgi:hypothetical protein
MSAKQLLFHDDAHASIIAGINVLARHAGARVVVAAERYYRTVYGRPAPDGERPWNIRERYLADTLDGILAHLGPAARIVVWAHNSHLGDARETDQGAVGELGVEKPELLNGTGVALTQLRPSGTARVNGQRGDVVTISLTARDNAFDTVLHLFNAAGQEIAYNDDGGPGYNSLIQDFILPADGEYTIRVGSFGGYGGGPYTL